MARPHALLALLLALALALAAPAGAVQERRAVLRGLSSRVAAAADDDTAGTTSTPASTTATSTTAEDDKVEVEAVDATPAAETDSSDTAQTGSTDAADQTADQTGSTDAADQTADQTGSTDAANADESERPTEQSQVTKPDLGREETLAPPPIQRQPDVPATMPENTATAALRQVLAEDTAHAISPWRFFYSEDSVAGGPLVVLWRRGGDPARVPRYRGNDGGATPFPGFLVYADLELAMETDRFDAAKFQEVNYAYGWAAHKKWKHCFGTVSHHAGKAQFLLSAHSLHEHGPGLAKALAGRGVPASLFVLRRALEVTGAARSLTLALHEIRAGEAQNFGYCDGGPDGHLQPILAVWRGLPAHVPADAPSRQAFVREAIKEHVPDDSRTCLMGDVRRLPGDGGDYHTHVQFHTYAGDAPPALVLAFKRDLKRFFGTVPSAFPDDHTILRKDVNLRGPSAHGYPALWGARVLQLVRPKMTPARTAYAAALGAEIKRLTADEAQLGHAKFARVEATARYYDRGGEGGTPLLLLGRMKEADFVLEHKSDPAMLRGYMQTAMEKGFLRFTLTEGKPIDRAFFENALNEAVGGMLLDGELGDQVMRLRHAKVLLEQKPHQQQGQEGQQPLLSSL